MPRSGRRRRDRLHRRLAWTRRSRRSRAIDHDRPPARARHVRAAILRDDDGQDIRSSCTARLRAARARSAARRACLTQRSTASRTQWRDIVRNRRTDRAALRHRAVRLKESDSSCVADALRRHHRRKVKDCFATTRACCRATRCASAARRRRCSAPGSATTTSFFRAHLTNRPLPALGGKITPEGVIHIERARLLWGGRLYERITLTNYGATKVPRAACASFSAPISPTSSKCEGIAGRARGERAGAGDRRRRRAAALRRPRSTCCVPA